MDLVALRGLHPLLRGLLRRGAGLHPLDDHGRAILTGAKVEIALGRVKHICTSAPPK